MLLKTEPLNFLKENGYLSELPPTDLLEPYETEHYITNLVDRKLIKIFYVRMNENIGGSGGFYEGVKRGYKEGYNWLWLMDDDVEPMEDALEKLSIYFKNKDVVALSMRVITSSGHIAITHGKRVKDSPLGLQSLELKEYLKEFVEINGASFVGFLIKYDAVKKIGFPRKDFFIYYDDLEYCIRLNKVGKILLIPRSIIVHKRKRKEDPKREINKYYSERNFTYLCKKYHKNKLRFYCGIFKKIIKGIIRILIYEKNKYRRIKFLLNIYYDGLRENFDNTKPKNLY